MDLAYLLSRYQNSLGRAATAACVASRAAHRALAAAYAERIRQWQHAHGTFDRAVAA
ncbi:hypothetical protein [uncultured Sphingomonas sp.]|uniref:hypothetical protein n=1 Tax=uncultured Sphingomonas sp. TaxID=158754 RepID=UPI0025E80F74|nr:hypothetical protein [uncultured Sphingomonas sp.]